MTQDCPRAKSAMTPCVMRDGELAMCYSDTHISLQTPPPLCVGCNRSVTSLGLAVPADWPQQVAAYRKKTERRRR